MQRTLAALFVFASVLLTAKADGILAREWSRVWAFPRDDNLRRAYVTANGEALVVGDTESETHASDFLLLQYDVDGDLTAAHTWGSTNWDWGSDLAVSQIGDIYVTGNTSGSFGSQTNTGDADFCLFRLSSSGELIWSRVWGSPAYDHAFALCLDFQTNVYVAGYSLGSIGSLTNSGGTDLCLFKFDPEGNLLWSDIWGSRGDDFAEDVLCVGTQVFVSGTAEGPIDDQPRYSYDSDVYLCRYTDTGRREWSRIWGPAETLRCYMASYSSELFLAGYAHGSLWSFGYINQGASDIFVLRSDLDGNNTWGRLIGDGHEEECNDIVVTSNGCLCLAGAKWDAISPSSSSDAYAIILTTNGTVLDEATWGSDDWDEINGVAAGVSRFHFCGNTYGAVDGQTNSGTGRPSALVSTYSQEYRPRITNATTVGTSLELHWRGAYDVVFDISASSDLVEWGTDPAYSNLVGQQTMWALLTNRSESAAFFRIIGRKPNH